jgi:tRNA threonylcarbamoyladenosine modification (KEOPS) complex  Pcc1 subunit
MIEAKFKIKLNSTKEVKIILESISPELKKKISKTDVHLYSSQKIIHLDIKSNNTSSLRAACNSYLRWVNTAYSINNTI